MRHPPNLLKQESSSAATLVNVLLRLASDKRPEQAQNRAEASNRLILYVIIFSVLFSSPSGPSLLTLTPYFDFTFRLGLMILGDFNQLKPDVQGRNIAAWSPVVAEVLEGFSIFDDQIVSILSSYYAGYISSFILFFKFHMYLPAFYPLAVELLIKEISPEIRTALRSVLLRISPA